MNTRTMPVAQRMWSLCERGVAALNALQPLAQLVARWYVASVFFRSGLTKLHDWDTTLALFHDEYHVPWLDPTVAAWLAAGVELALPVLLVFGLAGRFAAAGLFILNIVAVMSLVDVAPAALQQHQFWGSLLAALLLWGPGRWSIDRFIAPSIRARLGCTSLPSPARESGASTSDRGAHP